MKTDIIRLPNDAFFLKGTKALVTSAAKISSRQLFDTPRFTPVTVRQGEKDYEVVPWGRDNDLPRRITQKVYSAEVVASNVQFNIETGYGQGIMPVKFETDAKGNRIARPFYENQEITDFFESNDLNSYLLEQLTDLKIFGNIFPEIILNKDGTRITNIFSKEATFSRWESQDKEGIIRRHFYSTIWGNRDVANTDITITPVLDSRNPFADLQERAKKGERRFIVPVTFPTPGRMYYQMPYWWSIFISGWYDYLVMIPQYKKKLISELSVIRYHVELSDDYFKQLFNAEHITDPAEQEARTVKEFENLNNFLSSSENTNKSVISFTSFTPDGKEKPRMKITKIDDNIKGGEFIEDSEEAANIVCYAMGVHPSLIGASPGKNKTINGTEARELTIAKQAREKPTRDRLLQPLMLVKKFNNWPSDVYPYIADVNLVTLDKSPNGKQSTVEK